MTEQKGVKAGNRAMECIKEAIEKNNLNHKQVMKAIEQAANQYNSTDEAQVINNRLVILNNALAEIQDLATNHEPNEEQLLDELEEYLYKTMIFYRSYLKKIEEVKYE